MNVSAKDDFAAMLEILKLMHNVDYVEQVKAIMI